MKLEISCADHPKYQAKLFPRSGCDVCKLIFALKNDKEVSIAPGAVQVTR